MTNRLDSSQGDGGNICITVPTPPPGTNENFHSRGNNKVYKSGPLFLSSKGIGWTSWKKRWFILTRTSLVFFRSDPNVVPQKSSEVNLTLGGIDLNSSGSVVVKEDKKLLTVLFPDGRDGRSDGRAFTLKAETLEDLYEWKTALEEALSSAPSAALVMGQNGIFRNDQGNVVDVPSEQVKDRLPVKSLVIGRPILLALEDIDGTPSFLEKALRFMEERGVKVEGILRQAADVDDVERRIREYEQGKSEFSPGEDPHVIADCVKYVLRELPSSPVPASCCNALLEACRTERSMRVSAMRTAICETFPEPNRRLLQRILMMMQAVASNKAENRMSISAVAACMAPLLLRPLLAGDCELEHNFDMGGDGSVQLLQAAAAANHAQAIVITLLEEYDSLFGEGSVSGGIYSDSEDSGTETEELTEDGDAYEDDGDDYTTEDSDADVDDDIERASNESAISTEFGGNKENSKESTCSNSVSVPPQVESPPCPPWTCELQQDGMKLNENLPRQSNDVSTREADDSGDELLADHTETSTSNKSLDILNGPVSTNRQGTVWGRTPGKKNHSMESIDLPHEDEAQIQKLEATKNDLQHRITEEAKENARLQESLEKRKNALHEHRIALEKDVARLQEQLEKEKELRAALESGLKASRGPIAASSTISEKVRADLNEIAQVEEDVASLIQKADDLGMQLSQQREENSRFHQNTCSQQPTSPRSRAKYKDKQKNAETANIPNIHDRTARSKYDVYSEKTNNDKDRKQEPLHLTKENSLQTSHMDQVPNQKSGGSLVAVSSPEQNSGRPVSSSRRSGGRNEGANYTTFALSKLSNRLNFLKERRTQIANELQNIDKGRNSGSGQAAQNPEKGIGQEARLPGLYMVNNTSEVSEGQSSERKGPDSNMQTLHSSNNQSDKGRTENQPNLDRGKSESFPQGDKGRPKGSTTTTRTYSR